MDPHSDVVPEAVAAGNYREDGKYLTYTGGDRHNTLSSLPLRKFL